MAIITADSWDEFADGTYFVEDGAYTLWHTARVYKPFRLDSVNSRFGANWPYLAATSPNNGGTWVGVRELPSGRKYVCTGLTTNRSSNTFFAIESEFFYSLKSTYKLPKEGKTLIGWWAYLTPGSNVDNASRRFISSLQSINAAGQINNLISSMPYISEGQETFIEVHIDFDNNHIDGFHNGVQVMNINQADITDYRLVPQAQYRAGAASSTNALFSGLGPVIVAHNNPGDLNPTTLLSGMEVLPIKVETVVEQNGWASSDETKTIPEVLDPSVDTELTNTDSPFVIASPDELISKYRFNVPNISGSMHYVNLGVRAGSAPGRTDKVQTLLSFKNSISDFAEFDTTENMETHVIVSANKTPSGGNWTINDLSTLELWMNAKSSTSDNPYPFDVGPGPKELIAGDFNAGYFGTVLRDELISNTDLFNALNFTFGDAIPSLTKDVWFKFFWKTRVLFIPQKHFRRNVTFAEIYESGLAYGTDDNGLIVPASLTPTNQMRTISVLGYTFKVRLAHGVDDAQWSTGIGGNMETFSDFSEFGNLLLRVCADYGENRWDDYSSYDLALDYAQSNGGYSFVLDYNPDADRIAAIGKDNQGNWRWISNTSNDRLSSRGWRPVLELIPD